MRHEAVEPQPQRKPDRGIIGPYVHGCSSLTGCCEQISAEEMKSIANILSGDQAAIDKAHAEGIHVAGERFVLIGGHLEGNIYGRGQVRSRHTHPDQQRKRSRPGQIY